MTLTLHPDKYNNPLPHLAVDINLSGKDGSFVKNYSNSNYDRNATLHQIGIIMDSAPYNYEVSRILYNDEDIIKNSINRTNSDGKQVIRKLDGHDTHYHVEVKPVTLTPAKNK